MVKNNNLLVCPIHRSILQFDKAVDFGVGVPFPDGNINCPEGCTFEVNNGIPRFVPSNNYSSSFGLQWQKYQKTQLDSYTCQKISERRLEKSLDMPLEALQGKKVLEVGCGAGRFTEHLIWKCGFLVAVDISSAVDANYKNCSNKNPYILIQADINSSPLQKRYFDVVICLGVIQHTPSPEQTISSLANHVKPGGLLIIDHYTYLSRIGKIGKVLSLHYPLRVILKRLSPETSLKCTIILTRICDPIRKYTSKIKWLDRIASRLLPTICYYTYFPEIDPKICYEWNELDTHDSLTDFYKHYRSAEELYKCIEDLGFINISCVEGHKFGGNVAVARATYPELSHTEER